MHVFKYDTNLHVLSEHIKKISHFFTPVVVVVVVVVVAAVVAVAVVEHTADVDSAVVDAVVVD
jgi:hypothetical protein